MLSEPDRSASVCSGLLVRARNMLKLFACRMRYVRQLSWLSQPGPKFRRDAAGYAGFRRQTQTPNFFRCRNLGLIVFVVSEKRANNFVRHLPLKRANQSLNSSERVCSKWKSSKDNRLPAPFGCVEPIAKRKRVLSIQ